MTAIFMRLVGSNSGPWEYFPASESSRSHRVLLLGHVQGSMTLQPRRSNGEASRLTTLNPHERAIAAIRESRSGSGPLARAANSPQIAAARASKFNTRYLRDKPEANLLMRLKSGWLGSRL